MIAKFKKTNRGSVFALAFLLALGLLTLTDAQEQSEKPNTPDQPVIGAVEKPTGVANKPITGQVKFDAAADFWPTKNPNGAWSYGWMPRTKLEFTLYTEMRAPLDLNEWTGPFPPDPFNPEFTEPQVLFNPNADPFEFSGVRLASRRLNCHPGGRGERNVVRWTAPRSGPFEIVAAFEGSALGGTTTDASVYHNRSQLFVGDVTGYGEASRISFNTKLTVTTGDTLDFVVGYGSNRTYTQDSTQVDATLIDLTRAAPTQRLPDRSSLPQSAQPQPAADEAADREAARLASAKCINNLKQIGLTFRVWATDNGDRFPFNVRSNAGGTKEFCQRGSDGFDRNAALHFMVMSNELSAPKILVCPSDSARPIASKFITLRPANVTYQVRSGPNVAETHVSEILTRCPIHEHILNCDGSVHVGGRQ